MEMKLEDKVALMTGGSRGIGLAIAHSYVEAGVSAASWLTGQTILIDGGGTLR